MIQGLKIKNGQNINTAKYWDAQAHKEMGEVEEFKSKEFVQWLRSGISSKPEIRILDVGCARGALCQAIVEILESLPSKVMVTGVDISGRMIEEARRSRSQAIVFHSGDVRDFVKRNEWFDYIVSNHTLEHLDDLPGLIALMANYSDNLLFECPYRDHIDSPEHINYIDETFMREYQKRCQVIDRDGRGWVVIVMWIDLAKWRQDTNF